MTRFKYFKKSPITKYFLHTSGIKFHFIFKSSPPVTIVICKRFSRWWFSAMRWKNLTSKKKTRVNVSFLKIFFNIHWNIFQKNAIIIIAFKIFYDVYPGEDDFVSTSTLTAHTNFLCGWRKKQISFVKTSIFNLIFHTTLQLSLSCRSALRFHVVQTKL